ncbi:CPBP family intramembrane glutamic endopeptidase [Croceitalea marina]|uniref:CPBP family intramembrane glutamic endopeptidase n=1 Tax=Croceitalea marina TaxID=1775166 RepID=A0ABW5MXQ5_9FLAO
MYIEQGYKGLHEGWRYVVGVIAVFFGWQFIGGIPLVIALISKSGLDSLVTTPSGMSELLGANVFLFLMLLAFVFGILFLFIFVKYVHKQSFKSLTTSREKIDWKRIIFAFSLWSIVSILFILLDIYLSPDDYVLNFKFEKFLILAAIAIALIPIQTSMEEYFMRGYVMQGLGIAVKNKWIPLIVTSSVFGLLHIFNPEVQKLGYGILVFYIGTGFFLGIMTLMDEGLELALGFHAANNLTAALLVTADWTAFTTDSIYRDVSDPVLGWDVLVPVFIVFPILLFIFSKKYKWTDWKGRLFGKVMSKEEFLAVENGNPSEV